MEFNYDQTSDRVAGVNPNRLVLYSVTVACFAFTLVVGLFLFLRAEKVGAVLVGRGDDSDRTTAARSRNMQIIAFATVGLIMILQTFPHVINLILNYWFSREGWSYRAATSANAYIDFVTSLLQLALGIWLLFGASTIAALVNKVRGGFQDD